MRAVSQKRILAIAASACAMAICASFVFAQDPTDDEYADARALFIADQIRLGNYTHKHPHQLKNYTCSANNISCNTPGAECPYLGAGSACNWCDGVSNIQRFCLNNPNSGDVCYMTGTLDEAQLECGRQGAGFCVGAPLSCAGPAPTPTSPACHGIRCAN